MIKDLKTRQDVINILKLVEDIWSENQRLKERLEDGYAFDNSGTRIECSDVFDGIGTRDCTIEILEKNTEKLRQENAALREAMTKKRIMVTNGMLGKGTSDAALGIKLKEYRQFWNMTLRDVAKETGISNPLISQIETGVVKSPSFLTVAALAECYCADIRSFLDEPAEQAKGGEDE